MTTENIELARTGNVATVTLARPEKLNALTAGMWAGLRTAFETVAADGAVRVVVLRGAGGRAFCVGADIGEFERTRAGKTQAVAYAEVVHGSVTAIQNCPHPTIAAIEGLCVGGGVELAAACDLRFASGSSRFGVPIKRLGLPVDYPELSGLMRLVGPSNALEILYEGRIFGADEALQKGLVNRVVADAAFAEDLAAAVGRIASGAPLVARWHKRMVKRLEEPRSVTREERFQPLELFDSEDYRIGTRAFLEKRDPVFVGR
ncbi:MAG TPA: enoyl-CoA hydratase-related protein [Alphaproteobacteria bacterium]